MLVLTRKSGEGICIGDDIRVLVIESRKGQVKLGIEAPQHISVHRDEVYKNIQEENKTSVSNPTCVPIKPKDSR